MKAKYIIFEWQGLQVPVIFSPLIEHNKIELPPTYKPISAGFVNISSLGTYHCFGGSISLKLQSRRELDEKIIDKYLQIEI